MQLTLDVCCYNDVKDDSYCRWHNVHRIVNLVVNYRRVHPNAGNSSISQVDANKIRAQVGCEVSK